METPILLYDGWCVLCNWSVKFLLKHERRPVFRFAPLDSETGRHYLSNFSVSENIDSIIVVTANPRQVLIRAEAVMYVLDYLKWPWYGFRIFRFLPKSFLDNIYDFFARHRYQIWGKYEACMIPTGLSRERLIEP